MAEPKHLSDRRFAIHFSLPLLDKNIRRGYQFVLTKHSSVSPCSGVTGEFYPFDNSEMVLVRNGGTGTKSEAAAIGSPDLFKGLVTTVQAQSDAPIKNWFNTA